MLFALASLGATAQSAYADDSKTLTVSQNGDGGYATIQAAINHVADQADKAGWTITVEDGTYSHSVVLDGLDNLTIKAAKQGGATDRRCKIILEDQERSGSVTPSVAGNTINNGVVGLVNVGNTNAAAVISGNTLSGGSFAVDAKEPGTIDLYSNYQVFQGDYNFGYWALTNIDYDNKLDVSWGGNPGDAIEFVQAAIAEANAKHSNVLSINADMNGNLIRTFTWFKDAVYWVPYSNGSLTVSKSDESIVKAGEEFTFQIELSGEGISGTQVFYDGNVSDGTHANATTFTDGKAQVTLAKGESVTLEGIPAGTAYAVTETGTDGYETNPSGKVASGTIAENETAVASFTNAKRVDIAVTKVWDDGDDADNIRPESVTVDLLANGEARHVLR